MLWRRRIEPFARPAFHWLARRLRGLTLGVRGLVVDDRGRVLLIQHTYTPGWHMPGGGVERGETAEQALGRELVEEAGVEILGRARLLSVHSNHAFFRGDHVLVYRIDRWRTCAATSRGEIHAVDWFAPDALPANVTAGTRRRIAEALGAAEHDPHW
ncbi:MAG: NUDIX domain-containing protein [Caulobacteraceae bacterium]|nr:NUDIX domain-containing protein [Caulobacteraceae bacterium]